jgi:hypothetical protein
MYEDIAPDSPLSRYLPNYIATRALKALEAATRA